MPTTQTAQSAQPIIIGDKAIDYCQIVAVARHHSRVILSQKAEQKIKQARRYVIQIAENDTLVYGVNTGLGALCNVHIAKGDLAELSRRVILSHACGVGALMPNEQVRAIICAAIANFAQGHSGVRLKLVHFLIDLLNANITPAVPAKGSVGYLSHMAHIGLTIIGEGRAHFQGKYYSSKAALKKAQLSPLTLAAKEGLSLVNGTPCIAGLSCLNVADAADLVKWADITGAMSFEALSGKVSAFNAHVINAKPLPGQIASAANLRQLLKGSNVCVDTNVKRTQDALSLRAMPQVHGAVRDKLTHAIEIINIELNSATDNPLIFADQKHPKVYSGCNAHGESLALTMDMLSMALAELGAISERRIERLVSPLVSGLPPFLVQDSGLNSGFMVVHYTACSLAIENQTLTNPISTHSLPMSAMQEDHVSMGTAAALKTQQIITNTQHIIAIEWLSAGQAFEFILPKRLGIGTTLAHKKLRAIVKPYHQDRVFYTDIQTAHQAIQSADVLAEIEQVVSEL